MVRDLDALRIRLKQIKLEEEAEKAKKRIKIIDVIPIKITQKRSTNRIVEYIDNQFIKEILTEIEYKQYSILKSKNILEKMSEKYKVDFLSLNGYNNNIYTTKDKYLDFIINKIKEL